MHMRLTTVSCMSLQSCQEEVGSATMPPACSLSGACTVLAAQYVIAFALAVLWWMPCPCRSAAGLHPSCTPRLSPRAPIPLPGFRPRPHCLSWLCVPCSSVSQDSYPGNQALLHLSAPLLPPARQRQRAPALSSPSYLIRCITSTWRKLHLDLCNLPPSALPLPAGV